MKTFPFQWLSLHNHTLDSHVCWRDWRISFILKFDTAGFTKIITRIIVFTSLFFYFKYDTDTRVKINLHDTLAVRIHGRMSLDKTVSEIWPYRDSSAYDCPPASDSDEDTGVAGRLVGLGQRCARDSESIHRPLRIIGTRSWTRQ